MPRAFAAVFALTLLGLSGSAGAQGGETGDAQRVTQLEDLSLELSMKESQIAKGLQAGNCVTACEALASMQRAADRICELEPGPPCESAKRDVEDARARVRAACPDCVLARGEGVKTGEKPEPDHRRLEEEEREILDEDQATPTAGAVQPSDAPPAEDARGCAACTVGDAPNGGSDALAWLALGAALFVTRRRRG